MDINFPGINIFLGGLDEIMSTIEGEINGEMAF